LPILLGLYFNFNQPKNDLPSDGESADSLLRKNAESIDENYEYYHFGSRSLHFFPTACSLTACFMSALTMIGWPTEFFIFGSMFAWFSVAYLFSAVISGYFFVPFFYNSSYSTTFDYLDKRYDSKILKRLTTGVYLVQTIVYSGIVIYAPSLAISTVFDKISLSFAMILTTCICTLYTSLGGMKAVIWTDVLQLTVMISGFIIISIQGISDFGFKNIIENADNDGITNLSHFVWSIRYRHSFLSVVVGGTIGMWLPIFCVNQTMVQKYLACRSVKHARLSLVVCVVNLWILIALGCFCGYVMNMYYKSNEDISIGFEDLLTDQYIPFMILHIFKAPGFSGWYIASIYAGTLSTVASSISSMATTVTPKSLARKKPWLSKINVVVFGVICCGAAYLAGLLGSVVEAAMSVNSIVYGPFLGLFLLGINCEKISQFDAVLGYFMGIITGITSYAMNITCRQKQNDFVGQYIQKRNISEPLDLETRTEIKADNLFCKAYVGYLFMPVLALSATLLTSLCVCYVRNIYKRCFSN